MGGGPLDRDKSGFTSFASVIATVINDGPPITVEDFQLTLTFANGVTASGALISIRKRG
jgi:hypothetical protein